MWDRSDENEFARKRVTSISRILMDKYDSLTGTELENVKQFLCDVLYDEQRATCDKEELVLGLIEKERNLIRMPQRVKELIDMSEAQEKLSDRQVIELDDLLGDLTDEQRQDLMVYLEEKSGYLALSLKSGHFYDMGDTKNGDAVVAQMIIKNMDIMGYYWGWMHSGEPKLVEKRILGISKIIFELYDSLTGSEKELAKRYLCLQTLEENVESCDLDKIVSRLNEMEKELN